MKNILPLSQKMKDALWSRIRAINDEGQKDETLSKEVVKSNHFLEDFKGTLAQQRQTGMEAETIEVEPNSIDQSIAKTSQEKTISTLKVELALQENFLHGLFFTTLLRDEQVSPDLLDYLEAIHEMLIASWNFFKDLDIAGSDTAEYEVEEVEVYLHKINRAAHKAFEFFSNAKPESSDADRLSRLHSMLIRKRNNVDSNS